MPSKLVGKLHDASYGHTNVISLGCHSYSVPQHISEHVELIKPTVHFKRSVPHASKPRHKRQTDSKPKVNSHLRLGGHAPLISDVTITPALENCDEMITPACLQALYSVNYTPVATDKNTYGIGELHQILIMTKPELYLFLETSRIHTSRISSRRLG